MNTDERKAARARYWTGVDQLHVAEIAGDCHLMAGYPFGDTVAVFQGDEAEAYANLCAGAVHDLPAALDEIDRLEGECERLREALQTIVSRGEVFDAKGTHSKATVQIARAALEGRDCE